MAIHPVFGVLVRNYRVSETDLLVQSPNVDLKADVPRVIIRNISQDYMGEPYTFEDISLLKDDIGSKTYRDAAHGVYISPESQTENFPLWVCLERSERRRENHIWALNLSNFEFLPVPMAKVCWVPSHETTDGDLYTVISSPGKHGYEKEMRLPTIVQKIGLPEQAKFDLPPSSLSGFTRLDRRRQEELFVKQYMKMQWKCETRSMITADGLLCHKPSQKQSRQRPLRRPRGRHYTAIDEGLRFPGFCEEDFSSSDEECMSPLLQERMRSVREHVPKGFCRCLCVFSDLGPTFLDPRPLHKHVAHEECSLGSNHPLHCIFAAHRPDHCVINSSGKHHKHCIIFGQRSSVVDPLLTPVEHRATDLRPNEDDTIGPDTGIESVDNTAETATIAGELECLSNKHWLRDHEQMLEPQDAHTWATFEMPVLYYDSRPISPALELLPGMQEDAGSIDSFPDDIVPQEIIWNQRPVDYRYFMTPEPPEMLR
ncbi:hypothetical protein F4802DRAFT_421755 [Xylaria palmicola]|nr:hypothetical protein F4802DRAFT_421755 [Xylaria palmicola]